MSRSCFNRTLTGLGSRLRAFILQSAYEAEQFRQSDSDANAIEPVRVEPVHVRYEGVGSGFMRPLGYSSGSSA
jgi:hypothetical protein